MASAADFKPRQVGAQYTTDYRVYLENTKTGQPASPFHDVPLYANEEKTVLNFIVEVSRWSNAKLEISKEEAFNPIKQDIKKGKLRFVRNVFPYHGYIWNYGAFPQVSCGVPHQKRDLPCSTHSTRRPFSPSLADLT